MNRITVWLFLGAAVALIGCAGERQGLVCEEMEYRLNTMTYSPDQRAYAEEELRVCREEESQKKAEGAAKRQSIYDRFAASDSTKKSSTDSSSNAKSTEKDISVSNALKDSSGVETQSIYDRYKSVEQPAENAPAEIPADTSAANAESFQ
jgi:hypothetical protein